MSVRFRPSPPKTKGTMRHASLFSGIGGPEVAAAMLGWANVFHCEINPFGRRVLEYWFPESESYADIKNTDFKKWRGGVDILTGGFPCQPFSYAGQRRGADDDRYLWPEFKRVIAEVRPTWIVGENVAGITTMVEPGKVIPMESQATLFDEGDGVHRYRHEQPFTIERVCQDLEELGYAVQPIIIPACAVGAPHRRDRVFIVANANGGADGRVSREDAGTSGEERIQERDEIREPHLADKVRPEVSAVSQDTLHMGLQRDEELGYDPRYGNIRTTSEDGETQRTREVHGRTGESSDTISEGLEGQDEPRSEEGREWLHLWRDTAGHIRPTGEAIAGCGRWRNFPTVSPVHRGNDGLPFDVDDLAIPASKWRTESLKAYGNAIVPQVMYEIFKAIETTTNERDKQHESQTQTKDLLQP